MLKHLSDPDLACMARMGSFRLTAQEVRCRKGCRFSDTAAQTKDHLGSACPIRVIACPVDRCQLRGAASERARTFPELHSPVCALPAVQSAWPTKKCRDIGLNRGTEVGSEECVLHKWSN